MLSLMKTTTQTTPAEAFATALVDAGFEYAPSENAWCLFTGSGTTWTLLAMAGSYREKDGIATMLLSDEVADTQRRVTLADIVAMKKA
jgi:hypothetical protein